MKTEFKLFAETKKIKIIFYHLFLALFLFSCKGGEGKFASLDASISNTATTTTTASSVIILDFFPSSDPVNVLSTGSQSFSVTATGKAPLAYEWKLDGAVLPGCTGTLCNILASSLTTGAHTLVIKVSDSDSQASKTFNIIKNAPPVLSSITPSSSTPKININTVLSLSSNFSDANSDSMTATWKLNGTTISTPTANASVVTGASLTTLTFTPSASLLGSNTIELSITDGKEPSTQTWTVNVNYFSDICNNMAAGRACTLLGFPGQGSNIIPATTPDKVRTMPQFIAAYGDAAESYFFSELSSSSVWFYNKGTTSITILGQTILAGQLKNILGTGMSGTGIQATFYNDYPLNEPRGLAWDSVNGRLFVAEYWNNRVSMIDNTGAVYPIFGGGANNTAGNTNGSLATSSYCNNPTGLAYASAQNRLYVSCSSSHTIKYVDTANSDRTTWTASILVGALTGGVSSSGSVDGTNGSAGAAKINDPAYIKFDSQNGHLYVYANGTCQVKAIDTVNTTRTNYFFNAITLSANNTRSIVGSTCGTLTLGGYASVIFRGGNNNSGIEIDMSGSTLNGIIMSDHNNHVLVYINNTSSAKTIGSSTSNNIPAYGAALIWNTSTGTSGYYMPCSSAASTGCYLSSPRGLTKIGNKLYVADTANNRVRHLNISVANGTVTDDLGYDRKYGFGGNGGTSSENVLFTNPLNLYFDSSANKLLISDFGNSRIRQMNLSTGKVDAFIGNGGGSANTSNVDPSVVLLRGVRSIINHNGHYIYADTHDLATANRNCVVRAFNTAASTQTIFGVSTFSNSIQTIIGSFINGCGNWVGSATTGTDANARLNQPTGIATDGTNLYFTNSSAHCIIKLDQNGNMSNFSGLCGTAGPANAAGLVFSDAAIRYNFPTSIVTDPRTPYNTAGNMFILDQNTTTYSTGIKIRYINQYTSSVTIYGITVEPGEIKTIYTAPDSAGGDLAIFDIQVCYSTAGAILNYNSYQGNSSSANNTVICFNRDDSSGTNYTRFGRNPSAYNGKGAIQHNQEQEGVVATTISLAGPAGLAFDNDGNLYIAERNAHVIRKVTKWW